MIPFVFSEFFILGKLLLTGSEDTSCYDITKCTKFTVKCVNICLEQGPNFKDPNLMNIVILI